MTELATLADLTGREHLSFSSLSTYSDCSERFYLERVASVPQQQGWWLPAGTALHTATEWLDEGTYLSAELAWNEAWRQTLARLEEYPTKAGGRATKEFPNKEDKSYWDAKGAEMVDKYLTWRDITTTAGWSWLEIDGKPAIEVPVEARLEGTLVKGYIDRVMVSPEGEVVVMDLKSSQREPQSLQLDVYRYLLQENYGITATHGMYYMFRKGTTTERKELGVSNQWLAHYFGTAARGIQAGIFLPNVGMLCGTCGVREYCSVFGTPPAIHSLQDDTLEIN